MGFRTVCRALTVGSAAVVCALVGLGVAAGPASAAASACPKPGAGSIAKAKTATNVGASFSSNANTNTTTYEFFSTNENPVAGVPGLMKYCVYPTPSTLPTAIHSQAKGFNGASWTAVRGAKNFAFARPDGNKSNVPLDGETVQVGSAVWTNLPVDQAIVLHVNDAATCRSLYGGTSATCFVRPGLTPCGAGDTTVAYNSVPFDVSACPPLADIGFEATSSSEFGDKVGLTGSGDLKSITVTFRSWGCGDSGHWFSFDCATTPGETFPADSALNLTAHVYDVATGDAVGSEITSATYAGTIPFRPSANPVKCTNPGTDANGGDDRGKWYDAAANLCLNALPVQITFTFPPGHPAPGQVIWTVSFNTTHYGNPPIGESASCFTSPPGCGYDSLNVGSWTYANAPYSGTDVDPSQAYLSSTFDGSYCDGGTGGTGVLRSDSPCWTGFTPLAEIRIG